MILPWERSVAHALGIATALCHLPRIEALAHVDAAAVADLEQLLSDSLGARHGETALEDRGDAADASAGDGGRWRDAVVWPPQRAEQATTAVVLPRRTASTAPREEPALLPAAAVGKPVAQDRALLRRDSRQPGTPPLAQTTVGDEAQTAARREQATGTLLAHRSAPETARDGAAAIAARARQAAPASALAATRAATSEAPAGNTATQPRPLGGARTQPPVASEQSHPGNAGEPGRARQGQGIAFAETMPLPSSARDDERAASVRPPHANKPGEFGALAAAPQSQPAATATRLVRNAADLNRLLHATLREPPPARPVVGSASAGTAPLPPPAPALTTTSARAAHLPAMATPAVDELAPMKQQVAHEPLAALAVADQDILLDRLLERWEERLRELSIREFGFTGGVY